MATGTKRKINEQNTSTQNFKKKNENDALEERISKIISAVLAQGSLGGLVVIVPDETEGAYITLQNSISFINGRLAVTRSDPAKDNFELSINGEKFVEGSCPNIQTAKRMLGEQAIDKLKDMCFFIYRKNDYVNVTKENLQLKPEASAHGPQITGNSIAHKIMLKMGWTGGGLGAQQQGNIDSVTLYENVDRQGLGSNNLMKEITKKLDAFCKTSDVLTLVFDQDFTKEERALIHRVARKFDLKSKSTGSDTRKLTVSKKITRMDIVKELLRLGGEDGLYKLHIPRKFENMWNECTAEPLDKIMLYKWIDITSEFKTAVEDLQLGELLHDNLFGLFEAMSAIEMMDPKMDAGMICNRGSRKAKSLAQNLEEGTLKLDQFAYDEMIAVIDTTLACIVSWLEGHSLAQTVFTNLYLHKPYSIEDRTMKAFSLIVYKQLEIIKDFVHKAMVYEEEDFQPMQYGYHLNPDISEQRIIGMLREVEEELHRKIRSKQSISEIQAVHARIKFSRVFYQALTLMRREDQAPAITDCQRLLVTASDMLIIMRDTVNLGVKPGENELVRGFEPLINQRLLPPTFPRYTKIKPRAEALNYFSEMIDRFKTIMKIQSTTALHQVLDFFIEFSKTSPCLLSRSALQLLYPGTNPCVLKEILKEAVKTFICPPALVSKSILSNQQAKKYVDSFLTHCTRPFASFLQLCGHNRARQRDKLAHLLEEFTNLQDEAERVDAYLHNISVNSTSRPHLACFGTWILYHTLKIMIMYLLAGFELELYSKHEYYYIYWYLYEFLYGWLVSALSRADSFLVENELLNEFQKSKNASKKKPKHKRKPRPYNRDIVYYQALQNMCGGYYKALMGFRLDGKLTMPHPQFDSEQVRYEHRFSPFQNLLTPPPVQYSEFREMTSVERLQQPVDSIYFYITGCKHFHQARQLLENIQVDGEINDLLKITKTNFIVLKLLAGGHKKDSTTPPEFDFSVNKYFPIVKLT